MRAKRRRNLALVSRRAISGSILRWRARLTAVNRRSPISRETAAASWSMWASSASSSRISSCNLAKRPQWSGQSKPLFAAFEPSFWASINAGRERGMLSRQLCFSALEDFSSCLISSQLRRTCFESMSSVSRPSAMFPAAAEASSPKTWGWRRTSLRFRSELLDFFPVAQDLLRVNVVSLKTFGDVSGCGGGFFSKDMGMATDKFAVQFGDDISDAEVPFLGGHFCVKEHLQEQVAKFFPEMGPVAALDRVEDLIGLLQRVFADRIKCLLAVPWATSGRTQPGHDGDGLLKPLACVLE